MDNNEKWLSTQRAMILFISFANGTDAARIKTAAQSLLGLPLVTRGNWGDGSDPLSILTLLQTATPEDEPISVVVIPQASLTARARGKSLQYHSQLDKLASQDAYVGFLAALQEAALEASLSTQFKRGPYEGLYGSYSKPGVPLTLVSGEALTNHQKKALDKVHREGLAKMERLKQARLERWRSVVLGESKDGTSSQDTANGRARVGGPEEWGQQEEEVLPVLAGTFGNRQGLRITGDCGPFTHVFRY